MGGVGTKELKKGIEMEVGMFRKGLEKRMDTPLKEKLKLNGIDPRR